MDEQLKQHGAFSVFELMTAGVKAAQAFCNESGLRGRHGMAEKNSWNYAAPALNGSGFSGQCELEADACDKIEIAITHGAVQQVAAMNITPIYYPYFF